jgi:hypothetical protein
MKRILLAALIAVVGGAPPVHAADDMARGAFVSDCISAAASTYRLPPAVLVILLNVENGRLGEVSSNSNHTVDIGPMQVNDSWLPKLAAHWKASKEETYRALRDEVCANIEGGAWILRQALDEANGNLWEGVGLFHSHNEAHKTDYLRKVFQQAMRLQKQVLAESVQAEAK